jgi:uncharacterized protein
MSNIDQIAEGPEGDVLKSSRRKTEILRLPTDRPSERRDFLRRQGHRESGVRSRAGRIGCRRGCVNLRIRQIRLDGFEVGHVIHRHGLSEEQALEVESALIDAYPEVTNQMGGKGSDGYGVMHANQIIERYEALEATFVHKVLLINVNRTATERTSVYDAVRSAWKLDPKRAEQVDLVLAVQEGLIVGVFVADEWRPVADQRWEFVGREAPREVAQQYLRRRLPDIMKKRGAANPIRYAG